MRLLVGLGNPGAGYARNRHNIGFMVVDEVVRRYDFGGLRSRFRGLAASGSVDGHRVLALKPLTFMNESGRSVVAAVHFHKVPPEDVIVVHDEIDLAPGKVRVKRGGGHAGHNGLRSIHSAIGSGYARVRIGVGHPGDKDRVHGHVLTNFDEEDAAWVAPLVIAVSDHLPLLVLGDDQAFMSKVAETVNPHRPRPPRATPGTTEEPGTDDGRD